MKNNQSICFISPFMGPLLQKGAREGAGGAERQFYLFGKALAERGWKVTFVADSVDSVASWRENINVEKVPFKHLGGRKAIMLFELPILLLALIRMRPQYIVLKTSVHLASMVLVYNLFARAKLVIWGQMSTSFDRIIEGEPKWVRWTRWLSMRCARHVIAQTKEQALSAMRHFQREAVVIPNITENIGPQDENRKEYIFWCGNVHEKKRAEIFILLAQMMPGECFVMAMNGDAQSERYQRIRSSAERIANLRFLGSVPAAEIDHWFAGAKVYVHTSIREGFPNTYLQAWQQGCPVLSVNIDPDGVLEKEGVGCCLFKGEDHLAEPILRLAVRMKAWLEPLVHNEQRMRQYGVICRGYVERMHAQEVVTSRLESLLEEACSCK